MKCEKCGRQLDSPEAKCQCTGDYVLNAECGEFRVTGHPVGFVLERNTVHPVGIVQERDLPDGSGDRRVDSRPASGGQALSLVDGTGDLHTQLTDPIERGGPAEWHVVNVLLQALRNRGDEVSEEKCNDAEKKRNDARGKDAILIINGKRVPLQIVTVPADQHVWKQLSTESGAEVRMDHDEVVQSIRQALMHKKGKATETILALDLTHLGAIVGPRFVNSYLESHGCPEAEFSLVEVWLVGPTVGLTIRLAA